MATRTLSEWVFRAEAARIIGCDPRHVPELASSGRISTMKIPTPSALPRYLRSDCERVAREVVTPATVGTAAE